jgi:hypothetical protein
MNIPSLGYAFDICYLIFDQIHTLYLLYDDQSVIYINIKYEYIVLLLKKKKKKLVIYILYRYFEVSISSVDNS